jgi:hypothetical protein
MDPYDVEEVHDSSSDSDAKEASHSPRKPMKGKGGMTKKSSEAVPKEKFSAEELTWDTLLPYKKHPLGEKKFNQLAQNAQYIPKLFVNTLKKVMEDPKVDPPQKDPLKIVEAMEIWNAIQPESVWQQEESYPRATPGERHRRAEISQLSATIEKHGSHQNSSASVLSHGMPKWLPC